ncbi:MAG: hypothetical protein M3143_01505 [Actinomycetota bacterium]|nr:hypothetical protein [Actinomycetota bacterium]
MLEAAVADGWGDPIPARRADLTTFQRDGEHLLARTCRDLLRQAGAPTGGNAAAPPSHPPCGLWASRATCRHAADSVADRPR